MHRNMLSLCGHHIPPGGTRLLYNRRRQGGEEEELLWKQEDEAISRSRGLVSTPSIFRSEEGNIFLKVMVISGQACVMIWVSFITINSRRGGTGEVEIRKQQSSHFLKIE